MSDIAGIVRLESPEPLDAALLVVALLDVTYLDAPSRIVAERSYQISGRPAEIPFHLPLPEAVLPASASYVLKAEIRRTNPADLRRGDYLSTAAHPWSPGETGAVVTVRKI
ncbi:MAG: hypothetical protein QOF14_5781 [Hyphomicrobiales bacterium]|jgi:hypothetical protein|nr:hypothetical protein [Bradyrhizobium sp.]MEA2880585.1 hypothetical protein [Hyphomicrobiales bacterium]